MCLQSLIDLFCISGWLHEFLVLKDTDKHKCVLKASIIQTIEGGEQESNNNNIFIQISGFGYANLFLPINAIKGHLELNKHYYILLNCLHLNSSGPFPINFDLIIFPNWHTYKPAFHMSKSSQSILLILSSIGSTSACFHKGGETNS